MTAKAQQVSITPVSGESSADESSEEKSSPTMVTAASNNIVAPATDAVPRTPINPNLIHWFQDKGLHYGVRLLAIIGAIGLWHLASSYQWSFFLSFENVPTPVVVFDALMEQLQSSEFYKHIMVSLQRILISYLIAVVLGIMIGVFMGMYKIAEDIFLPYIEILRPIPAVAWIPMAILIMPTEESSIIFITFLGALFPIILNTVHGVEQTPVNLIRAAKSFGAGGRDILWHVVLPGALPSILAGLAIGMGVAWFSLLAGEIISGQYGIGYFTWSAYTLVEYPNIIIGMLIIGLLGTGSTALVRMMAKPMLRWQGENGVNR